MRISLAMIARNEEAFLGHCLDSVRGLVDEVVVVDTGSTDGTAALAQAKGALLGSFPWVDDFAAARNESLRLCTGDWVLVLDADEAIDALDHDRIRQACLRGERDAWRLVIRNYFVDGSHSSLEQPAQLNRSSYEEGAAWSHYADSHALRLCRRMPGLAFEGRIHELLDPFFEARGRAVGDLEGVIHHYGQTQSARKAFKETWYLDLARREARERPGTARVHFNLALQALAAGQWEEALAAAGTFLRLEPRGHPSAAFATAVALQQLGRAGEALPPLEALLRAQPDHAAALARRAVSLAVLGRTEASRASFRRAMTVQPGFATAFLNLSELEEALGRRDAAREALLEGLLASPGDPSLLGALVRLDIRGGNLAAAGADALRALGRIPEGGGGLWHRLGVLALLQEGRGDEAGDLLARGIALHPGDADLERLEALVRTSGRS